MAAPRIPQRPYLPELGPENPIVPRVVVAPPGAPAPSSMALSVVQGWDAEGDVYAPPNAGAEAYVPAQEAVPPQLPDPLRRKVPLEFEPHGILPTILACLAGTVMGPVQLGFEAHAVLVDNLSNKWVYIPAGWRYVPPSTFGNLIVLVTGTQVAHWIQQTPTGHGDAAVGAGGPVVSVWFESPEAAMSNTSGVVSGV